MSLAADLQPVLISPGNSVAATGMTWRFWRESRPHLVRQVSPTKSAIVVSELLAELRDERAPIATEDEDPAELARRALGKKRRAG